MKRDKFLTKRDELHLQQKELERETQKIIKQTEIIGNTEHLFAEFRVKCKKHNEKLLQQHLEESKLLGINLEFTADTSEELMDASMNNKIEKAKSLLKEVETALKAKIK